MAKKAKIAHFDFMSMEARHVQAALGLSKGEYQELAGAGCPRNPDGLYCMRDVVRWMVSRAGGVDAEDIRKAELRKKSADATLAEMKIAEACERLVEREAIIRSVRAAITSCAKILQDSDKSLARYVRDEDRAAFIINAGAWVRDMINALKSCESGTIKL